MQWICWISYTSHGFNDVLNALSEEYVYTNSREKDTILGFGKGFAAILQQAIAI